MYTVPIKPISVNQSFQGKKYQTKEHKEFKVVATALLKRVRDLKRIPEKKEFFVIYKFYISASMDYDNCIKSFQDCLCSVLGTDDRYIAGAYIRKIKAKRGDQKIEFDVFEDEYTFIQAIQDMGENNV